MYQEPHQPNPVDIVLQRQAVKLGQALLENEVLTVQLEQAKQAIEHLQARVQELTPEEEEVQPEIDFSEEDGDTPSAG